MIEIKKAIRNEIRTEALKWWKGMTLESQIEEHQNWFNKTVDARRKWPFALVTQSTSTIERIYRELVLDEVFND